LVIGPARRALSRSVSMMIGPTRFMITAFTATTQRNEN